MASSPSRSKTHHHVRSTSLPSISHPLIPQFNEHLTKLNASEAASSSLPSIRSSLENLEDLYDSVDDLLLLPSTQQAFCHDGKLGDEVLEGYLRLLDVCAVARDAFTQTKQDIQDLLSTIRRRREANDLVPCLASRKNAKKLIQKALKDVKSIISKKSYALSLDKDQETLGTVTMLKEAEAATLAMFESLLSYAAGKKVSRQSGWSLVSKLARHKNEGMDSNEFEKLEAALHSFIKSDNVMNVEDFQNWLGKMESSVKDIEEGLQRLFRWLIKTRVSLLNILNH